MTFQLGRTVATPNALAYMEEHNIDALTLLIRHQRLDTDCNKEDSEANRRALKDGGRIFSVFNVGPDKLWIITESDRSSTCILKPEDY